MNDRPIAYLVSQYPAYSHTFILREILHLESQGMKIRVASINAPDRTFDALTTIEKEQAQGTFYIKQQGPIGALKALVHTLQHHPAGMFKGLRQVLKLGGWDLKALVLHFFYWVEALIVTQWMDQQKLGHLHVHFATPAASVGMLTQTISACGFSFTVHGPDEFYDAPGYHLPEKIVAADFIVCISHYARSQIMKLSPIEHWSKTVVSRLGVDCERFKPQSDIPRASEGLNLLCVGRLTAAKGQGILLASVAQLIQQGEKIQLVLVGTGPDRQSLEDYARQLGISQAVTFTGAVDQDHILDYYREADVFVLPSFAEGLPVVLMEAMAQEIPCVTTAITGVYELIQDHQNGILVPASDCDALSAALTELSQQPELRRRLGQAGRETVIHQYNLPINTQKLYDIFQQKLGC